MALVVTFMLQVGLSVAPRLLYEELKRFDGVLRGVLFFLVAQPLVALLVIWAFQPPLRVVLSLILLSVVGVAPLSTRSVQKTAGNAPLALVLTLVLGAATVFTAPPTARWLLGYEGDLDFNPAALEVQLLLFQAIPLAVGFVLRGLLGGRAARLAQVIGWINLAVLAGVIAIRILPHVPELGTLGWRGTAAGVVFSAAVAVLGAAFGGRSPVDRRTLAALANKPNVALALALLAAARAPASRGASLLAMFLLRLIVGALVHRLSILRRATHSRQ
jgi:predicted Na+-dependent transporter